MIFLIIPTPGGKNLPRTVQKNIRHARVFPQSGNRAYTRFCSPIAVMFLGVNSCEWAIYQKIKCIFSLISITIMRKCTQKFSLWFMLPIILQYTINKIHEFIKKIWYTENTLQVLYEFTKMLTQRPITLVLIMISSCIYTTNDLVLFKFQILIKILVGA